MGKRNPYRDLCRLLESEGFRILSLTRKKGGHIKLMLEKDGRRQLVFCGANKSGCPRQRENFKAVLRRLWATD